MEAKFDIHRFGVKVGQIGTKWENPGRIDLGKFELGVAFSVALTDLGSKSAIPALMLCAEVNVLLTAGSLQGYQVRTDCHTKCDFLRSDYVHFGSRDKTDNINIVFVKIKSNSQC